MSGYGVIDVVVFILVLVALERAVVIDWVDFEVVWFNVVMLWVALDVLLFGVVVVDVDGSVILCTWVVFVVVGVCYVDVLVDEVVVEHV